MERKWGSDHGSSAAWKSAVFRDKDGSVSGVPDSYILMNDGINNAIAIDDEACEIKPTWNAAVCKGDIGRVGVGGGGGGFGFGRCRSWLVAGRGAAAAGPGAAVLAHRLVRPAVPVERLSRQSFSAEAAGSSP